MDANVECLDWGISETLRYFKLLDVRSDNRNAVIDRFSTTVL